MYIINGATDVHSGGQEPFTAAITDENHPCALRVSPFVGGACAVSSKVANQEKIFWGSPLNVGEAITGVADTSESTDA